MSTPLQTPDNTPRRRAAFNRYTILAFVAGAALVVGVEAFARSETAAGWHHGATADMSGAGMSAHVDHMLKHFYVEIAATDAQKAQIGPLVQQAVTDLLPLHSQLRAAHTQLLQVLAQPAIDRSALEAARAAHLQLAEQASTRLTQLIADVGDVLTPAQRTALVDHVQHMHGMPPG